MPSLEAPNDLTPRSIAATLVVPAGADLHGAAVEIDAGGKLNEITRRNNRVGL